MTMTMTMMTMMTMIAVNSRIDDQTTHAEVRHVQEAGSVLHSSSCTTAEVGFRLDSSKFMCPWQSKWSTMTGLSVTFQALLWWEIPFFQTPSKIELSSMHLLLILVTAQSVCSCSAWGCLSCRCSSTLRFSMETPGCSYRHAASASMQCVGKGWERCLVLYLRMRL